MLKLRDNCRSGRRNQLVWNGCLRNWKAFQDFEGRRGGKWIFAMTATECALPLVKAGEVESLDAQGFDSDACENNIDDRVKCADFMKINRFDRAAVYLRLGFSNSLKNGDGMLFDEVREFTFFDHVPNVRQALGVAVLIVRVMVAGFRMFALLMMMPMLMMMAMGGTSVEMLFLQGCVVVRFVIRPVLMMGIRLALYVDRTGVNIELDSRNPAARLAFEMQVKISKIHLGKLPFES
jgi:hypothetical protein